ncbi:NAD-dependent epimerase/dehydratase family protein [Nitrincola schmidtii]|uniref:NAD-dependent epimerase/dehydratase family protein n=1 Tax=Nitrincola schmidtii TaxID=1730894 RepID=UPI00124ED1A6|nr:NAD-dependent epimerase/dehydratase family protein [Nitrincola schmidtii]
MQKTTEQFKLLMVGLGDLGARIANLAVQQNFKVLGMRRGQAAPDHVQLIQHDASQPWPELPCIPDDVVLCLSPNGSNETAYRQAYVDVAHQALKALSHYPHTHVWLISSTGVYGQSAGEWVDETSERNPVRETAKVLLEAENLWLNSGHPVTLLRPSGIYGPGRYFLIRQAQQGILPPIDTPIYTNRIHVDDAARAVLHLIQRRHQGYQPEDIYNLTDTEPAALYDILSWLHQQLDIKEITTANIHRDSKRIRHDRLRETGFKWLYPNYRVGYQEILKAY